MSMLQRAFAHAALDAEAKGKFAAWFIVLLILGAVFGVQMDDSPTETEKQRAQECAAVTVTNPEMRDTLIDSGWRPVNGRELQRPGCESVPA